MQILSAKALSHSDSEKKKVIKPILVQPSPSPSIGFKAEYFNNISLSGEPVLEKNDSRINFDWRLSSPNPFVSADNFSVRWAKQINLPQGNYQFSVLADDGVRLLVDDEKIIDQWHDHKPDLYTGEKNITKGEHKIVMEYYEKNLNAFAKLSFFQEG